MPEGYEWLSVGWSDLAAVRALLDAGGDPNPGPLAQPLHAAAEHGSAGVVAELAGRVDDVDAEHDGRTALWAAVRFGRGDNALALVAAGADPWREMMAGWSPGRLSLVEWPDLFDVPPGAPGLTPDEVAAIEEAPRLIEAVSDAFDEEGFSFACVSGIDAAEAVRRLGGAVIEDADPAGLWQDASVVAVTGVPGGCVVAQPWAYGAADLDVVTRLSAGTLCYAMYANPKSGDQGDLVRDGVVEGSDLTPGLGVIEAGDPADEILRAYLYEDEAVAYCCAVAGLRPEDSRAFGGRPDRWVRVRHPSS